MFSSLSLCLFHQRHYGRRNSEPAPSSSSFANFLASSRQAAIRAEDWMLHVITASWHLVHHQMLPDWLQDNEHLHTGHRLPLNSFRACFQSIFRIHTETGNIWTHLIGMFKLYYIAQVHERIFVSLCSIREYNDDSTGISGDVLRLQNPTNQKT